MSSFKWVVWIGVIGSAMQLACHSPAVHDVKFESQVAGGSAAPIEKLLVIASFDPKVFTDDMFDGFQDALTERLALCGVQARALYRDPKAVDFEERVTATLRAQQASAVLTMNAQTTNVTAENERHGFKGTLGFDLAVLDAGSKVVRWRAGSKLEIDVGGDWSIFAGAGATFATSLASQLRFDGMLPGCPQDLAGWPEISPPAGCMRIRKRVLQEASQLQSDEQRAAKEKSAPMCAGAQ